MAMPTTPKRLASKRPNKRVLKSRVPKGRMSSKGRGKLARASRPKPAAGKTTAPKRRGSNRISKRTTTKRVLKPKMTKRSSVRGSRGTGRSKLTRGRK